MKIAIVNYPQSLKSSVYGLHELFEMAGNIFIENACLGKEDSVAEICSQIVSTDQLLSESCKGTNFSVVILPPALESSFYLNPEEGLLDWLKSQHRNGAILCSACAGAFILAQTGLLKGKRVTTHWGLNDEFIEMFPDIDLDVNSILINTGDIMTAGGLMSWIDLGLEIVQNYLGPNVMAQLGKNLVVDTGDREQSYYRQFVPKRNHGDEIVLKVQQHFEMHYPEKLKIPEVAALFFVSERTLLRRFSAATGLKPVEYLQCLRVQKACDLLEQTRDSFECISENVGYEDSSACRKVFVKVLGITPKEFRQRFVKSIV